MSYYFCPLIPLSCGHKYDTTMMRGSFELVSYRPCRRCDYVFSVEATDGSCVAFAVFLHTALTYSGSCVSVGYRDLQ